MLKDLTTSAEIFLARISSNLKIVSIWKLKKNQDFFLPFFRNDFHGVKWRFGLGF